MTRKKDFVVSGLNHREIKLIEASLIRAKSDLAWELSQPKLTRIQFRVEQAQKRIHVLKSWLTTNHRGEVVKLTDDTKTVLKALTKATLKADKTKEFEDMITRLDADPKCGATMALTSVQEVDAVFDLIQKELKRGRKNLVFVWPKPIVKYYTHRVHHEFKKLNDSDAQRRFAHADPGLATADDYDLGLEDNDSQAPREPTGGDREERQTEAGEPRV